MTTKKIKEKFATMFSCEFESTTVDDAIKLATNTLKMSKDELQIKVLSEGQQGLFGLRGEKPAKIKVSPKTDKVENILKFYFIKLLDFANNEIVFVEVKIQNKVVNITAVLKKTQISMLVTKKEVRDSILVLMSSMLANLLPDHKINLEFKFATSSK